MKTIYLDEAQRIGDQILATGIADAHGLTWETLRLDPEQKVSWATGTDINEGTSGIALFLAALYRVTRLEKYRAAAEQAMRWVEWQNTQHPNESSAFMTGQLGVSFAFLKLFEVTGDKRYLSKALAVARSSDNLAEGAIHAEYMNGAAGTLLALMHLHAVAPEPWLTDRIQKYTDYLLRQARYTEGGLRWGRLHQHIRPLCGFSHGAAGIGFVFLEIGHYFKNPAFYSVAKQAFAYEDQFYDQRKHNWPDFRVKMYTPQQLQYLEDRYRRGVRFLAPQAKDIFVWCHGAAGIGMSRQRAYELTGDETYSKAVADARNKARIVKKYPFTLCHGHGGNAELFTGEQGAVRRAKAALREKRLTGTYRDGFNTGSKREDVSFMNGIAGIGYFMLRVHDPSQTPSILAPTVPVESNVPYAFTLTQLRRRLIENAFPRAVHELAVSSREALDAYFAQDVEGTEPFVDFVKKHMHTLPANKQQTIQDIFTLELAKQQFDEAITSQAEIYIASRVENQNVVKIIDKPLAMSQVLLLSAHCKVIQTKNFGAVLLRQTPTGVTEQQISPFCAALLVAFARKKTIGATFKIVGKKFSGGNVSVEQVDQAMIQQVSQAIQHGILTAR